MFIGDSKSSLIIRNGLVRFASEKYSTNKESLANSFIHLCNNSVNSKNLQSLDENWTLKEFKAWIEGLFDVICLYKN